MCCPSFRKLAVFDTWSRLVVHVAMDNTVVIEEISECRCVATLCFNVLFLLAIICISSLNDTAGRTPG